MLGTVAAGGISTPAISNIIAKKIAKLLDGNIDFIFVDIEKKIQTSANKVRRRTKKTALHP